MRSRAAASSPNEGRPRKTQKSNAQPRSEMPEVLGSMKVAGIANECTTSFSSRSPSHGDGPLAKPAGGEFRTKPEKVGSWVVRPAAAAGRDKKHTASEECQPHPHIPYMEWGCGCPPTEGRQEALNPKP